MTIFINTIYTLAVFSHLAARLRCETIKQRSKWREQVRASYD